jgi:hypothetical protein
MAGQALPVLIRPPRLHLDHLTSRFHGRFQIPIDLLQSDPDVFTVRGTVKNSVTDYPLSGLFVKAFYLGGVPGPNGPVSTPLMGSAVSESDGSFIID